MRPVCRWRTTSAVAAALLAVACTPSERGAGGDRANPKRTADSTVTVVVVGDPTTLDPYARRATFLTQALARPVYASLFRLGPDGNPEKDLVNDLVVRRGRALVSLVAGPLTARDVVASARRARAPSGFAGLEVRAVGRRRVELRGANGGWARRLARATWVLPKGRATGNGGGPFRVTQHTPGFETVLERRPESSGSSITKVRVRVAPDTPAALRLIDEGRADAGWIPSTVNLEERVVRAGLVYAGVIGWESIALDFRRSSLAPPGRAWVAQGAGRGRLGGGLVRDEGEIARDPVPPGAVRPPAVFLAAPAGDELLVLLLRAVQRRLAARGAGAEAVTVPAGDPFPPGAVRIVRLLGAPGAPAASFPATWPLFRVESTLVWRPGLSGLQPNPTLDGPLWNLEEWRLERPL
jgi:hypothetical protein